MPPAADDRNLTHDPPTATAFRPLGREASTTRRAYAGHARPCADPPARRAHCRTRHPCPFRRHRGPAAGALWSPDGTPLKPPRTLPTGSDPPGTCRRPFPRRERVGRARRLPNAGRDDPGGLDRRTPGRATSTATGPSPWSLIVVRLASAPDGTGTGVGSHHRRPLEVGAAPSAHGRRPGGFVTEPGGLSAEGFPTSQPRHDLDLGDRFGPGADRACTPNGPARQDRLTPD